MLSKEEVEAEKASMRAIDARPIKKVAEARQRKRKRLQVRLFPGVHVYRKTCRDKLECRPYPSPLLC